MAYLHELNTEQFGAVTTIEGPMMIVAGAGSGKTRVLTYRIAYLLENGVDAFGILALTFTNKAASEMRNRIANLVGDEARNLWMGTFHAVFSRILRIEAEKLGYPQNFTIYDTDDSKSLIKTIVKEMELDETFYKPGTVYSRISAAKNSLLSPEAYEQDAELMAADQAAGRRSMAKVYQNYAWRCKKAGAMDFDDLLFNTHLLFEKYPEVLHKYQHKFKHILVDEYQDTNFAQYKIVKMLAAVNRNLCVVGDDAQSIYAFRGANISNILNFSKDYPDMLTFKLEQNYRSTQTIVGAAGSIIAKNTNQIPKELWTANDLGGKITVLRAISDNDEGRLIAQSIFEERMRNQLPNKAFAILYRTNAQSRAFEESLRKLNLPYRIYGGLSFYQRKEIKDFVAYLRMVINPRDEEALKRIINYPIRGIGKKSVEKLIVIANEQNLDVWTAANNLHQFDFGVGSNKITDFVLMIKSFMALQAKMDAYQLALHIAKQTGLLADLRKDNTTEGTSRIENIDELLNAIKEFIETEGQTDKSLGAFLQTIALLTDADKQDPNDNDRISLMTIHAAKGLEFPFVYIVGLEESLFPSQLSVNSRTELEEERRLFYVAITRAEKKLHLSFAMSRFKHGMLINCEPSRFLQEIKPEYIQFETFSQQYHSANQYSNFVSANTPTRGISKFSITPAHIKATTQHNPTNTDFVPDDPRIFAVGNHVLHQRFGKGVILALEGKAPDIKAKIKFETQGEKSLLLRYAKLQLAH